MNTCPAAEWLEGDGEGTALGNGDCEKLKRHDAGVRAKGIQENGISETKKTPMKWAKIEHCRVTERGIDNP